MALKWGIVAAGGICNEFANAVCVLNKDEHQIVANAARDRSRAEDFAKRYDIPKSYGSYLELAQDPNVEIAYIGTLHPQHFEVAQLMLQHGKHVLCEVPLGINEKQARKLIDLAKEKNLFLSEGLLSRYFPSIQYLEKQIKEGALGEVNLVDINFTLKLTEVERLMKKESGGGGLLEFAGYCIQVCQYTFGTEPKSITATATLNDEGVDVDTSIELNYGDNKIGKIRISLLQQEGMNGKIVGTKGQIKIPFFNMFSIFDVDGSEKSWPAPDGKYDFKWPNCGGFKYEADEIRKSIRSGKTQSDYVAQNDSLLILRIMDEIRKQIGVKYAADD